jgi:hypothetical protein
MHLKLSYFLRLNIFSTAVSYHIMNLDFIVLILLEEIHFNYILNEHTPTS